MSRSPPRQSARAEALLEPLTVATGAAYSRFTSMNLQFR